MCTNLLCKLHASIQCTPDGLFLTIPDDRAVQAVKFLQSSVDCLYCWTLPDFHILNTFTLPNIQNIAKISPACASLMSAMRPFLHCHCTGAFNPSEQYKHFANAALNSQDCL